MSHDRIYSKPLDHLPAFQFDEHVAQVFSDMIKRSVPGYTLSLEMLGIIAEEYVTPGSRCYDLGCSLGASTLSIRHKLADNSCQIIGVDNSEAMISKCAQVLEADTASVPVELRCEDVQQTEISNASLVVMNFILMFVSLEERLALLQKIHKGLNPGGVLVLSEKIALEDAHEQELLTRLHHDFKHQQGYSRLEIAQKRAALENVLIPETLAQHKERLNQAGFSCTTLWLQCYNFVSLIAEK